MSITFMEPGTDATGDFTFWPTVFTTGAATITSDTVIANTGPRSMKFVTGASEVALVDTAAGVLADAGRRFSYWVYLPSLPASFDLVGVVRQSGSDHVFAVWIDSTGRVDIWSGTGPYIVGSQSLTAGAWHHLAVSYVVTSTTNFTIKVWLNGALSAQATQADGTLERTGTSRLEIGSSGGVANTVHVDDVYVDDLSDLTFPGRIYVTAKKPAANNTNNFDTAIGANPSNRWTNVNEVPLSQTNGWQHAAISDVQENYTLEEASVGDVDFSAYTVVGRCAWIVAKGTAGGAGTPKIMDNGSESAIVLTNAAKLFTVFTTDTTYPSNAAGIGIRSTNNADDTFLYECGTLIAATPPRRWLLRGH